MSGPGWRGPLLATLTDRRFSYDNWIFERAGSSYRHGRSPDRL
ncbi:MAG: hypothetical protein QOI21_1109 [Actinomycetota bacterium]|jgi:hypothetical protein|nr:hypothetical protein [Actinomycetota bacterium]